MRSVRRQMIPPNALILLILLPIHSSAAPLCTGLCMTVRNGAHSGHSLHQRQQTVSKRPQERIAHHRRHTTQTGLSRFLEADGRVALKTQRGEKNLPTPDGTASWLKTSSGRFDIRATRTAVSRRESSAPGVVLPRGVWRRRLRQRRVARPKCGRQERPARL